ncbi:dUTP diphosphatase [Entomoplasma ellychniae]|uniref:dUTP diphosphatase n=2 Tax=Entomoplasmataceae TaxID=33925 RepID=A0A2S5RGJ3_9MOLU|nr:MULTISPECIES: dUTP diphosphatase [Entomoplasmataceae]PPE05049.1 dUTP diphosphatase [Entomoplasma ellychniae]PPE06417.1 dUTP diphosphatase [Mesoplasma corruscae]
MIKQETLKWLSEQQEYLDSKIIEKHSLSIDNDMFKKKIIAFWVELGEYANEEKSFKYWKQGAAAPREVQLEEYIDGLHFIVSLGNQIKYDFTTFEFKDLGYKNNIDCYFDLIQNLTLLVNEQSIKTFSLIFNSFLQIAHVQKYSENDLINTYKKKHAKNQQRQVENY